MNELKVGGKNFIILILFLLTTTIKLSFPLNLIHNNKTCKHLLTIGNALINIK